MKNQYKGRVVFVGQTEAVGKNPSKPFYKRIIVIDDSDVGAKYPNPCQFEATGEKCQYLDDFKAGDVVTVDFFLNGREYVSKDKQKRWFTSNHIAFIKRGEDDGGQCEEGAQGCQAAQADADVDDMPF